ncbi:MAG: hypothetical protein EPN30_01215 [Actinomycetota bacterium]|nr:MAG: hypothetical protein EPN30_01215 [Actinomycetota bacterium]
MEEHISRAMWRLYEPIHSVVYFHPNATNHYRQVGLKGGWMSYFASRSAALGTPSEEVVEALFYHFSPALVQRAIPDAWQLAQPGEILEARHQLAVEAIYGALGQRSSDNELRILATQLLDIARSLPLSGRALYAAHLNIDWENSSELMLFGASTLLREHRGDSHNAALGANGIDGVQSHLLQIASGAVTHDVIFPLRGWSKEAWDDGFNRLTSNGVLSTYSTPQNPILTDLGQRLKHQIELQTDNNSDPWSALPLSRMKSLQASLVVVSEKVKSYVGFPVNNPIGV